MSKGAIDMRKVEWKRNQIHLLPKERAKKKVKEKSVFKALPMAREQRACQEEREAITQTAVSLAACRQQGLDSLLRRERDL